MFFLQFINCIVCITHPCVTNTSCNDSRYCCINNALSTYRFTDKDSTLFFSQKAFFKLMSSTENELFLHYIFMDNTFSLPTASGFPLKFSLSGVFAPGARGGLTPSEMVRQFLFFSYFTCAMIAYIRIIVSCSFVVSFSQTDLSFMPSVGLEFITHMGVHIPDYVDAGIEMHTNAYHESAINAKLTVNGNQKQIKLSIPAPTSNTQLFSIRSAAGHFSEHHIPLSIAHISLFSVSDSSNKLLSISSGQTKIVPSLVEDRVDSTDCQPLFSGLNLCTIMRYSSATSDDQAPYYPLSGETR